MRIIDKHIGKLATAARPEHRDPYRGQIRYTSVMDDNLMTELSTSNQKSSYDPNVPSFHDLSDQKDKDINADINYDTNKNNVDRERLLSRSRNIKSGRENS